MAAAPNFDPVHAFHGKLDFTVAYGWSEKQIFDVFLDKVVADPDAYGVPASNKHSLGTLLGYMKDLRLKPGETKLQLRFQGDNILPSDEFGWNVNTIHQRHFILFDFLGLFLSLMGPAPTTTDSPNPGELTTRYFLPLVAVYSQWCRRLGSKSTSPTIVQITWTYKASEKQWYAFLGASRAGVPDSLGVWNQRAGLVRFQYLKSILGAAAQYDDSAVRRNNGGSGQRYGNCGETYPFLYILGDGTLKHSSYGIAVDFGLANKIKSYDGRKFWVPEGNPNRLPLKPPCENCQELLRLYGVADRLPNFHLWNPQLLAT